MSYSAVIGKLETLKKNLTENKSSVDKIDLDGSWKGSAHDKQSSNIKDLGSGVDSQVSNIESLITAMKAADLYDAAKKDYETAQTNRNGLDKEAENYQSLFDGYTSTMNDAQETMEEQKKAAESALGAVGDSYESKLSDISTTDLKDTTFVVLSSAVAELAPDTVDVDKNASQASEWSNIGNSSSSGSYSGSYGGSSGGHSSSGSGGGSGSGPYVSDDAVQNYVVEKIDMSNVPDAPKETICAANCSLNVKSSSKAIKSKFSKETVEIVTKHANDFNYSNFRKIIKNDEDFENYCKNVLGGVFAKWTGKNKRGEGKTASEFQEIGEYVFGLMTIWGFDYCNGDPGHYGKYGANNKDVASNAFYPAGVYNSKGKNDNTNGKNIDTICAGTTKDGINMTVNCNYGMDYLYKKAGILGQNGCPNSTCSVGSLAKYAQKHGDGLKTNVSELKVGDLIECYREGVPTSAVTVGNAGNLNDKYSWYHVCCVGEVEKNAKGETTAVVLYEAGHRFTNSGNFKHRIEINNGNLRKLGSYGSGWVGIGMGLTQDSYTTAK